MFTDNFKVMTTEQRVELRNLVVKFLADKAPVCKKNVINAMVLLLSKIVKLAWHDHDSHKKTIDDLLEFIPQSQDHCIIAVLALEQILVEMTYVQ